MDPGETIIQEDRTGHDGSEIQQEMCQHDNISWEAHNSLRPFLVGLQEIALKSRRQLCPEHRGIPELEDGRIEVRMRCIIHILELLDDIFITGLLL